MSSLSPILQMPSLSSSMNKRVLDIDEEIEKLTHAVENVSDGRLQAELEHALLTAKLKRQKLAVMSAVANTQMLLTEMQILTAECDINIELQNIKRCKRLKLDPLKDQSGASQAKSRRYSVSSRSSSKNSKNETKNKSTTKIGSNDRDTKVSVDSLDNFTLPKRVITRSPPLLGSSSSNSASSLTSSLVSEFNRPYVNENTQKIQPKTNDGKKKSNNKENLKNNKRRKISHSLPVLPASYLNEPQPVSSTPIKHSMPAIISRPSNTFVPRTIGYSQNNSFPPQNFYNRI